MTEPKTTFVSGHSDKFELGLRFPGPIPNASNVGTLRSVGSMIPLLLAEDLGLPSNGLPLPEFEAFDAVAPNKMWTSSDTEPLYIHHDDVASMEEEVGFLGVRRRVVVKDLPGVKGILRCICQGTWIVFKGLDADDVSYFETGQRVVCSGAVCIEVFARTRGSSRPVTNSVIWPPFTLALPSPVADPSTKLCLNPRCQDCLHDSGSYCGLDDAESEKRLVAGRIPVISNIMEDLFRGIYRALIACIRL